MAISFGAKFIETSVGLQHNVDELLVGVLKQIRLRYVRTRTFDTGFQEMNGPLKWDPGGVSLSLALSPNGWPEASIFS